VATAPSDAASRAADATRSLATALPSAARGALQTAMRGLLGLAVGARAAAYRERGARAVLVVALARLVVQLPADALLLLLARLVSAAQTLLGWESPGRPLHDDERALLHDVFGAGLDLAPMRVKAPRLGLLGWPGRAFVVGDTIHVPGIRGSLAAAAPALLVHEATHVWQHQRHGTRYLSECLLAQWCGEGYDLAAGLARAETFAELNFEQQAELLEGSLLDPHGDATPLLAAALATVRAPR
jgi:hypothetical protein